LVVIEKRTGWIGCHRREEQDGLVVIEKNRMDWLLKRRTGWIGCHRTSSVRLLKEDHLELNAI